MMEKNTTAQGATIQTLTRDYLNNILTSTLKFQSIFVKIVEKCISTACSWKDTWTKDVDSASITLYRDCVTFHETFFNNLRMQQLCIVVYHLKTRITLMDATIWNFTALFVD